MYLKNYLSKVKMLKQRGLIPSSLSGPIMISWDITERCNFDCLFCFNNSSKSKLDSLERDEIFKIAEKICNMHPFWTCICGGEPLLKEEVFDIAKILSECGIQVSMVTNGWHINEKISKILKNSGFKAVQISLDGCKAETHDFLRQRKGAFIRALKAIENCVNEGIHVEIAFCPTKLNYKELGKVVDIAVKMGAKGLRSQPLMILGRALLNKNLLIFNYEEEEELIETIKKKQEEYIEKIEISYGNPLVHFFTFPHLPCSFLHITSDGNIKISPYIPITFGNILKDQIEELWNKRLSRIWQNKIILEYIKGIEKVTDFEKKNLVTGISRDQDVKELACLKWL